MVQEAHRKVIAVILTVAGVFLFLLSVASMSKILLGNSVVSPIFSGQFLLSSFVFLLSLSCFIIGIEKFKGFSALEEKVTQFEGYRAKEDKLGMLIIFLICLLAFYLAIDSIAPPVEKSHFIWAVRKFFRYFFPLTIPFLIPFVLMYIKKK